MRRFVNGTVCGPDNSSTIISQSTFVVDIPGNERFTCAIFLLWSSVIGVTYIGVPVTPSTFTSLFSPCLQDYIACASSISESANSNHFSFDVLEGLPRNMYMDGMQFYIVTLLRSNCPLFLPRASIIGMAS